VLKKVQFAAKKSRHPVLAKRISVGEI